LAPVMHLGFADGVILVSPSLSVNSLIGLFDLAKANPARITWGSFGVASSSNLYIEWLKNAKGISFLNVPYKTPGQAWQALLAGEVQVVTYTAGTVVPQVKAGKAVPLAVSTPERSPFLPGVPTLKESGMDIAVVTWFGIMAPSATPREIIRRLNAEMAKEFFNNAPLREKILAPVGLRILPPAGGSPEAFAEFLKAEQDMYAGVVKVTGLKIE
jgi:tripartite-type tricarboxylate transporter receptor subunit TctC